MLRLILPLLCVGSFALAAPVWTRPTLSIDAVDAALQTSQAAAKKAPPGLESAWRRRIELLTQLVEVLGETDALDTATPAAPIPATVPVEAPSWSGLERAERAAEDARAAESAAQATHDAITRLIDERAQRRARLVGRIEGLDAQPPDEKASAELLRLQTENQQLEKRLLNMQIAWLDRATDGRRLATINRQLKQAQRRRQALVGHVQRYRGALKTRLDARAAELAAAPEDAENGRARRINAAERTRLQIDDLLGAQRQRLRVERNELEMTRRALASDPQGQRTARRLKSTLWRLQRRRPELTSGDTQAVLAQAEAARVARLDVTDALLDAPPGTDPSDLQAERAALSNLITRAEMLRATITERSRVFNALDQLVRARLFWIQDAAPIWTHVQLDGWPDVQRVGQWFGRINSAETGDALKRLTRSPVDLLLLLGAVLVLPIGLLIARRRLQSWFGEAVDSRSAGLRRVGVALVMVALPALSLWLTAVLIQRSDLPIDLRSVLHDVCVHVAICVGAWLAVRRFIAADGLVHRLLGAPSPALLELARALRWLILGYGLFLLPARLLRSSAFGAEALARLAVLGFGVLVLVVVVRLTRSKSPWVQGLGDGKYAAYAARGIRWLTRGVLVVILAMEALGYHFGARWLAQRMLWTTVLLVPLTMGYRALADRAGPVGSARRRWALSGVVLTGALGLALIWGINEGAIRVLSAIYLVGQGKTGLSVLDVIAALVVLTVLLLGLRHLPKLLKLTVFRAVRFDEGIEYAITTIARYVFFFIGMVALLSTLKINLEKLGWLVAALGVGLGFGLQEIVSNFICGVIILVERPVQVGDFISIGDLEGRVLHINIRSTTVLSLDRREFIVPNKDLITRDVTNWTRTDRIVRMTVPIGVAYGSDIEQVTGLLMRAAEGVPGVMADPAPQVLFMNHGDSSLDFEVRVHVPDPYVRFRITHAVNAAINATLVAHDIEIPFPQRDVHLIPAAADVEETPSVEID